MAGITLADLKTEKKSVCLEGRGQAGEWYEMRGEQSGQLSQRKVTLRVVAGEA